MFVFPGDSNNASPNLGTLSSGFRKQIGPIKIEI